MANRFFDTNYYKSPYVRGLKGSLKSLYSFIICDCTAAGVWNFDLQAAGMYIGFEITPQEFEYHFVESGKAIHLGNMKFFFPDFIEHQYPKGLQPENRAHKNIITELKKIEVLNTDLSLKNKGALKELHRPTGLCLSQGKGQGQGNIVESATVFYNAEEVVLKNEIEFERICMSTRKDLIVAKDSLHKFHLHLMDKEQYPKTKKSIFAGFEKWLLNEKKFNNGSTTHQQPITGHTASKLGTSDARIKKASEW